MDSTLLERLNHVVNSDFVRCSYTKAVELLQASGKQFQYPVFWGCDLQTEHERYICEEVYHCPVFLTDYPAEIKSFYMRLNDDGKTVAAADCLFPVSERSSAAASARNVMMFSGRKSKISAWTELLRVVS